MSIRFSSNRINKPIDEGNYPIDARVNALFGDVHTSYYTSRVINIKKPATSLKVVFDGYRPASTDFRVLYSVVSEDYSEVDQKFTLFPGYLNMVDTDGDGFGDTSINFNRNDGRADSLVTPGEDFKEYQYTINDLDPFTGFVIKIVMNGSNQAEVPVIKNIRALALA